MAECLKRCAAALTSSDAPPSAPTAPLGRSGRRRSSAVVADLAERVYAVVKSTDGISAEAIARHLHLAPGDLRVALHALQRGERICVSGRKRGTRYRTAD